jgi:hypothetical protein
MPISCEQFAGLRRQEGHDGKNFWKAPENQYFSAGAQSGRPDADPERNTLV